MNPKLEKIIDVALFKDFFFEKLDSEDLYFYLYMRNIVYISAEWADFVTR